MGSSTSVAKYLFLHGKRGAGKMLLDPNRRMSIEFSSVVGTRAKSY